MEWVVAAMPWRWSQHDTEKPSVSLPPLSVPSLAFLNPFVLALNSRSTKIQIKSNSHSHIWQTPSFCPLWARLREYSSYQNGPVRSQKRQEMSKGEEDCQPSRTGCHGTPENRDCTSFLGFRARPREWARLQLSPQKGAGFRQVKKRRTTVTCYVGGEHRL